MEKKNEWWKVPQSQGASNQPLHSHDKNPGWCSEIPVSPHYPVTHWQQGEGIAVMHVHEVSLQLASAEHWRNTVVALLLICSHDIL